MVLTSINEPYNTLYIQPDLAKVDPNANSLLILAELETVEISSTHNLRQDTSTSIVATERIWP
jgi:hypothetical protein